MTVQIRLFASLRERAGSEQMELELPDGATVADALARLDEQGPLAGVIGRLCVQMAVNRDYATQDTALSANDELALIPPVSGGQDASPDRGPGEAVEAGHTTGAHAGEGAAGIDLHVLVTDRPLSLSEVARRVVRDAAGAVVVFEGITREVPKLEYEAYRPMAQERITAIAEECIAGHKLTAAAVEHRIGAVPLGEPSVLVAVSAGHREEAFAGAREIIDRVKAEAPIWKREVEIDGSGRWIHG